MLLKSGVNDPLIKSTAHWPLMVTSGAFVFLGGVMRTDRTLIAGAPDRNRTCITPLGGESSIH